MALISKQKRITIPTGGGTSNIDPTDPFDVYTTYLYTGTGTLTSNYTIAPAGTIDQPYLIRIIYGATFVANGNDVTIFGVKLSDEQVLGGNTIVECQYNQTTSAWVVTVLNSTTISAQPYEGVAVFDITSGGGTKTLDPDVDKRILHVTGSSTLTANWTIQGGGTPKDGAEFFVKWMGGTTPSGNDVTIFGITLSGTDVLAGGVSVYAYYSTTLASWVGQYIGPQI